MTKSDLINQVAESTGVTKTAAKQNVEAVLSALESGLKQNGKAQIAGFGTFKVTERKEREGRNPKTGAKIQIAASKAVKFKAQFEL